MGEGNEFFNVLLWPAIERLLNPQPDERLLDIACGNGLTSRRLAASKCRVSAFDGSSEMIRIAASSLDQLNVDYRVRLFQNSAFLFHASFARVFSSRIADLEGASQPE